MASLKTHWWNRNTRKWLSVKYELKHARTLVWSFKSHILYFIFILHFDHKKWKVKSGLKPAMRTHTWLTDRQCLKQWKHSTDSKTKDRVQQPSVFVKPLNLPPPHLCWKILNTQFIVLRITISGKIKTKASINTQ